MLKQSELEEETADAEFRANIFASNPHLYHEIFEKEEEFEIEEIIPETPEELQRLLTEMRRHGVFGD